MGDDSYSEGNFVDFGFGPRVGQFELWIFLTSLVPLAGLNFSLLLPLWLHKRGHRGPAVAVPALSLMLWLPAVAFTAIVALPIA